MTLSYSAPRRSVRDVVTLLLWRYVGALLFRLTPMPLFVVRSGILRVFGAKVGRACKIYPTVKIWHPMNLELGSFCGVGEGVYLYNQAAIIVGEGAVLSRNCFVCTATHDYNSVGFDLIRSKVIIAPQAWLASNCTILPGLHVGEGAVIGACAVLTKDALPWGVYAGNPDRWMKQRTQQA